MQTVIVACVLFIMCSCVSAEKWHCGPDNVPFLIDTSEFLSHTCPGFIKDKLNNACHKHDNCYHDAKPANGGNEKMRLDCDSQFCGSLLIETYVLFAFPCGKTLAAHCGISAVFGKYAQEDKFEPPRFVIASFDWTRIKPDFELPKPKLPHLIDFEALFG